MNPDLTAPKIEEIRSMTGLKSNIPDMPVTITVQEALNLYGWCQDDRETPMNFLPHKEFGSD